MATLEMDISRQFVGSTEAAAQGLVEALTGNVLPRREAKVVLERIADHKWYLSEQLGRDVGMRVAAIDLVENFYEPVPASPMSIKLKYLTGKLSNFAKLYFTSKGNTLPL